ncbi:MAG: hypothetical protein K2M75_01190 [Clostridia bacterium]|nr:hypothetical protein [Clostridia bacterium]
MNNKEAIIQKIIDDAKAVADANIAEANDTANQIFARAKRQIDRFTESNSGRTDALYQEALERSQVVANLDAKKLLQGKKKQIIDKAFDETLDAVKADQKTYLALIEKMILSCCEDGDEVIVAKEDDKIITKKLIADLAKKSKKSLTKSDEFGDFKGGVILSGKNYDKNLTLELELSLIKEKIESNIDGILFGSKD